ncbi:hypothetical protein [Bradyrhizobium ottawaense]|uniref:hypothetical protein n=1 Tax=Bradyrhizobium ottawaense TaxID=931866 RepID=UPI0027D68FA9|nr:hypothetical protein BwSF21_21820 [Bradyrhizobium ottawaense]GMO28884.1 hypothetical protein BwSF12_26140 [Bradyrhizobium ottawaense]GMO86553.1 hypothetical protein BwSF19_46950 [Bradyrhizobium ottawaense]
MERVKPDRPTVTPAIRRAMLAVNDQKVFRIYGPNGSVWKCERDRISPRILWKLITYRLIEDEPETAFVESPLTTVRMRLSQAGFDFLASR